MQYLAVGCRAAIAVVFALAVAGKTLGSGSFADFRRSLVRMGAVSERLAAPVARATVTAEALTLVLVVIPLRVTAVAGCALAALLTTAFSSAILRSLHRGNRAPCRCFGRSSTPLGPRHLVRNAVLLLLSLLGTAVTFSTGALQLTGALVALIAGLFAGLAIAAFEDIAQLVVPLA